MNEPVNAKVAARRVISAIEDSDAHLARIMEDSLQKSWAWQRMVHVFHMLYGAPIRSWAPEVEFPHMSNERVDLRLKLIAEEFKELMQASNRVMLQNNTDGLIWFAGAGKSRNIYEVADALGDLIYVICGFAVELGIDLADVMQEIHASNLTKMGADGRPIVRPDGKILKGPFYRKPNLQDVVSVTIESNT